MRKYFQIGIVFVSLVSLVLKVFAETSENDKHIEVAMRMIGHEILRESGDSISRILPVEKDVNRYSIRFGTNFQFEPEKLISTTDRVVRQSNVANHYLVEVRDSKSGNVVYSYEKGNSMTTNIVPCVGRIQPEGSYFIDFTILQPTPSFVASYSALERQKQVISSSRAHGSYLTVILLVLSLLLLAGLFLFFLAPDLSYPPTPCY